MTYDECLDAAKKGLPVKAWYIDGVTKIVTIYERIMRVGVWFIEKNGKLIPSEYVELLQAGGGHVTQSGPERCELATEDELKTEIREREEARLKRLKEMRYAHV